MDKFILDRATYKQIKSMDKDRLSEFLTNIYMNGKNDNKVVEVDMELFKAELGKIKGIGENRLNESLQKCSELEKEIEDKDLRIEHLTELLIRLAVIEEGKS